MKHIFQGAASRNVFFKVLFLLTPACKMKKIIFQQRYPFIPNTVLWLWDSDTDFLGISMKSVIVNVQTSKQWHVPSRPGRTKLTQLFFPDWQQCKLANQPTNQLSPEERQILCIVWTHRQAAQRCVCWNMILDEKYNLVSSSSFIGLQVVREVWFAVHHWVMRLGISSETDTETFLRPNIFESDTETFFETKFVETNTDTLKKWKKSRYREVSRRDVTLCCSQ